MPTTEEQIKTDIKAYMAKGGGSYSSWYVGVSKDPKERLFTGHGVYENGDLWIYRQAYTSNAARNVESYFINTLGTDGGAGGGDKDADWVYAYKKNAHTNP
jgi:hypothetical protein